MERTQEHLTHVVAGELPRLSITTTKSINDFEVIRTTIEATGYTGEEAKDGLSYLLSVLHEVRG